MEEKALWEDDSLKYFASTEYFIEQSGLEEALELIQFQPAPTGTFY